MVTETVQPLKNVCTYRQPLLIHTATILKDGLNVANLCSYYVLTEYDTFESLRQGPRTIVGAHK